MGSVVTWWTDEADDLGTPVAMLPVPYHLSATARHSRLSLLLDFLNDFAKDGFQVSARHAEGMRINGERSADNDERSAVLWRTDSFFNAQPTYCLHRDADGFGDGFQV